jgi:hypothetical protein
LTSTRELAVFIGLAWTTVSAILMSGMWRRATREELHDIGQGTILGSKITNMLFGIRAALVRKTILEKEYALVARWVLLLAFGAQVVAAGTDRPIAISLTTSGLTAVGAGVLSWVCGVLAARSGAAAFVKKAIRAEIQMHARARGKPIVLNLEDEKDLDHQVSRLLQGLEPKSRSDRFASELREKYFNQVVPGGGRGDAV